MWFLLVLGMMEYTKQGYEAAAKSFNTADLDVDMSQRFVMVTGANSGIGKETALEGNSHFIFIYQTA